MAPVAAALDVGCGVLGWLRLLSEWVGPEGRCTGTDSSREMLDLAGSFVQEENLDNVTLTVDDLFHSALPEGSFDLVHARFQLAPLGRPAEQLTAYRRLLAPGGTLVLEDPDSSSWHFDPDAPDTERLIGLIRQAFRGAGGDFDSGRRLYQLMADAGLEPQVRAEVVALEPGHPYLRLPLQFAASLRSRLEAIVGPRELEQLLAASEAELGGTPRTGLTFTLMQVWASVP